MTRTINDGAGRVHAAAKAAGWSIVPGQWPLSAYLRHGTATIHFEWNIRGYVIAATTPLNRRMRGEDIADQIIKEMQLWNAIS